MQSWEPRQPAFKISQKWEFSDTCFLRLASNDLEASVVSVMAEALILKLLGRVPGKYKLPLPAGSQCHGRNICGGSSMQTAWSQRPGLMACKIGTFTSEWKR